MEVAAEGGPGEAEAGPACKEGPRAVSGPSTAAVYDTGCAWMIASAVAGAGVVGIRGGQGGR